MSLKVIFWVGVGAYVIGLLAWAKGFQGLMETEPESTFWLMAGTVIGHTGFLAVVGATIVHYMKKHSPQDTE